MCDFVCETMSHAISGCSIGQLYTFRCLLSDILGVYQKRLHVLWVHSRSLTFYTSFSSLCYRICQLFWSSGFFLR